MKRKGSFSLVLFLLLLSSIIGLLKDFVMAFYFGASHVSDAYFIAYSIPITLISFISISINTVYIPIVSKIHDDDKKNSYTSKMINYTIIISGIIIIFIALFSRETVLLFASGLGEIGISLSSQLIRISMFIIVFIGMNSVLSGYIQFKRKHYWNIISNILNYVIGIIGILMASKYDVYFLAYGLLLGYVVQSIVLFVLAYLNGFKYQLKTNIDTNVKTTWKLVVPILITSLVGDIGKIVDKTIASQFIEGTVSMINYAQKIQEAIINIFSTSFVAISYPVISQLFADKKTSEAEERISMDVTGMLALIVPITLFIMVFSKTIVHVLFVRGAVDESIGLSIARILVAYSIGIITFSLRKYYVRIFYSVGDTKTPNINSIIVIVINIVLGITLSYGFGVIGIAIASSISSLIGLFRLMWITIRKVKINHNKILSNFFRIISASSISIILTYTFSFFTVINNIYLDMVIIGMVFVIIYIINIFIFRLNHVIKSILFSL